MSGGIVDAINLALLDFADPDERRLLIEAEHPRLRQALRDDVDESVVDGQVMDPRLHIALHETVAERLRAGEPPETWATAKRLSALGYYRHEVLHMLMSVLSDISIRQCRRRARHRRTRKRHGPRWQHCPAAGRRSERGHRSTGLNDERSSALAIGVIRDAAATAAPGTDASSSDRRQPALPMLAATVARTSGLGWPKHKHLVPKHFRALLRTLSK